MKVENNRAENCRIEMRPNQEAPLFHLHDSGELDVDLTGYITVPIEAWAKRERWYPPNWLRVVSNIRFLFRHGG